MGQHKPLKVRASDEWARIDGMPAPDLKRLWCERRGSPPPKTISSRLMRLALAWDVQAAEQGGEKKTSKTAWDRIASLRGKGADASAALAGTSPISQGAMPEGTRLVRQWKGRTHEVVILGDSAGKDRIEWNGRRYRSLSAVAKEITGTSRNGPAFFGLRAQRVSP